MKAITTKYHGATNTRGSRISAEAEGVSKVYVPYDYSLNTVEVHAVAVKKLCNKLEWTGKLICGGTKNGYVWCFVGSDSITI